jgi:putative tryptophan/tyrosine transport system substrate-binding protein
MLATHLCTLEATMTCRTLGLLIALAISLVVAALAAEAPQPTTGHRIGWLRVGLLDREPDSREEAFRQGLHDLGYVEGQHLVLEGRDAQGRVERLPDLAAELVRLQVEVLVARGAPAIRAAQHATRTVPIVMAGTSDAVELGFVASLARPGGNITGVSWLGTELPGKRLELLKEIVPQRARIAVLANPANPYYGSRLHNLTGAAQVLGLHLHVVEVRQADELAPAFAALPQARADALLVMEDALVLSTSLGGRLPALAAMSRLPAMYGWREVVAAGGLMSYGPSFQDIHRRAAVYVDKILKGATPADLPVEQPTTFELVINLKTAQALGLTMPASLLFQATEVLR